MSLNRKLDKYFAIIISFSSFRALILGSDKLTHNDANTVLFYDPIVNDFLEGPPMNSERTEGAFTLLYSPMHKNRPVVLALGGCDSGVTAEILDYSIVGTGWEYSK